MNPSPAPARLRQARVVPLAHSDYLRFLDPRAHVAAAIDFGKAFQSPELFQAIFGKVDDDETRNKAAAALKEMEHLWISYNPPKDLVVLMTGNFENGAAAGMFYAQGVQQMFLAGSHVMMIGSEASLQAAYARLSRAALS